MNSTRIAALAALSICTLSACVPTAPAFDERFSESTRVLQAQQVRNPEAPVANRDKLPDGLEGRAAREAYERYQKTFTDPPPATMGVIGISSGGGGSQ